MVSIGQLLRDRRDALGLAVGQVAEEAHVSEERLLAFEAGKGNITAAALDRVAHVLAVDPLALRELRLVPRPTATLFFQQFRTFADFRHDEDAPRVAVALERATNLLDVNVLLGRASSVRARFEPEQASDDAAKDGYRLANRVRVTLGNEVGPIPDLVSLLEDTFDILVRVETLASSGVDALSVKDNESGAAALIVNRASERRANPSAIRVDLAHELSHVLFDPANGRVNLVVDEDGQENKTVTRAEQRARAFAAELLMPAEGLRRLLGQPRYAMGMAEAMDLVERTRAEFVTSIEITVNHLVNREYVWGALREALIKKARSGVSSDDRGDLGLVRLSGRPDLLERRVLEALDRDLITQERARELLGLSVWEDLRARA